MLRNFLHEVMWPLGLLLFAVVAASTASSETHTAECGSSLSNRLVMRQADAGNADAMVYLGTKLIQPDCTIAQQKDGVKYLARAVDAGHPEAMFALGMLLISDATSESEERLGLNYIQRSAELGQPRAAAFFGAHLMSESQTEDQRNEAFLWLGRAASDGSVLAAMTLSTIYQSGLHGIVQDRCSAALWRETAG